jgi:predicted nucleotidyltransferase
LDEIKKIGNIHQPQLKYEHALVKEMRKTYSLLLLFESGITDITENITSIALYGSFESGTFDDKSDIDILILSHNKELNSNIILQIENNFNRELQATIIPYYKWESMKAKKHDSAISVLRNLYY